MRVCSSTFRLLAGLAWFSSACSSGGSSGSGGAGTTGPASGDGGTFTTAASAGSAGTGGGGFQPACAAGDTPGQVPPPEFVRNLPGETSWFASPVVVDLDGDGARELVTAAYSVMVFDASYQLLAQEAGSGGRVYAPHVVADLDGDGVTEVVVGRDFEVIAYEWVSGALAVKSGWPADTTTAGNPPEVRGLAAADLDRDGTLEVVATTTQTEPTENGGAQVFVYAADGQLYQPPGTAWAAWPRYNAATGPGNDADRNAMGHAGYGCYGLNVGIGDIDDDPELEILATYDNHHIQAFDHDGVALDAAPWFTNRATEFEGERLTWGQFIRWADPAVEAAHLHDHTGEWPHPSTAEWLQWTASPPGVVDLDGDGKNEVVGVPNVEFHDPYETQAYAVMVLEGAHGDGSRSAMRKAGWETLPRGEGVITVDGWYPPTGVPAPALTDLTGDGLPEIVVSLNDGGTWAFAPNGEPLWRVDHTFGKAIMFASEATVADLDQDGFPEVLVSTFGAPEELDSGRLLVISAQGEVLHHVALPNPDGSENGNGNGAPAAPAVGDLDGDGAVEIFVQTFEHGLDVFTVPGSAENCLPWPTARGGATRAGSGA
jgi:hypothetical protein